MQGLLLQLQLGVSVCRKHQISDARPSQCTKDNAGCPTRMFTTYTYAHTEGPDIQCGSPEGTVC